MRDAQLRVVFQLWKKLQVLEKNYFWKKILPVIWADNDFRNGVRILLIEDRDKIRRQQYQESNLEDFTKYVEDEAILMSDLLFSWQALSEYLLKPERLLREDQRKKKVANYRVQSDESQIKKDENVDRSKSSKEKERCVLCNGSHNLDECKAYNNMVVKECSKFLTKQKLCYGCCEEISSTHTAREILQCWTHVVQGHSQPINWWRTLV